MQKNRKNSASRKADTSVYTVKESVELLPFLLEMMSGSGRNCGEINIDTWTSDS